jgi:arylsulfatase A-like enzyme
MMAAPGVTTAGQKCSEVVSLLDIFPTLTKLCGIPAKPGLEGVSLLPQLQNPAGFRGVPAITTHEPNSHSIRLGKWRYARYYNGSRRTL